MVGQYKSYLRDRNMEILRMRDEGMKYREIGEKLGISTERIRQICVVARRVLRQEGHYEGITPRSAVAGKERQAEKETESHENMG